jgi:uncharacterized membrane protein YbhN (UPF0104 family)
MSQESQTELINKIHPRKIILPVIIGLGVVGWFIARDVNINVLKEITFTWKSVFWLFTAILFISFRTYMYMARIRILTDNELSWVQSFRVIMLWEFTSSITPSTVGGTGFAIIFIHKEGISVGKSTAVVLLTSFLDELYFVVMLPLLLLLVGGKAIFITTAQGTGIALLNNLVIFAIAGYLITMAWVLLVGYGLFINPVAVRNLIRTIFKLPLLSRWKDSADRAGSDIIESSNDLRLKTPLFWGKALLTTFLTWTSRYWLVNIILLAFFSLNDHLVIFARQLVLWIMMIISPTPGGSGFAELILGRYISDLIPVDPVHAGGVALAMALIWRIISYYPFLLAGALIIPGWINKKFVKPALKPK